MVCIRKPQLQVLFISKKAYIVVLVKFCHFHYGILHQLILGLLETLINHNAVFLCVLVNLRNESKLKSLVNLNSCTFSFILYIHKIFSFDYTKFSWQLSFCVWKHVEINFLAIDLFQEIFTFHFPIKIFTM